MGRQYREVPEGFREATQLLGVFSDFAKFCRAHDAQTILRGVQPHEFEELEADTFEISAWLDSFSQKLEQRNEY